MTKRSGRPENPSQRGVNSRSTCRSAGCLNCCDCPMQSASRPRANHREAFVGIDPRRKIGREIRVGRRPVLQPEGDAAGQPERSGQDPERTVRLALPFAFDCCRDSRHVGRVVLHSRRKLHRGHDRRRQQRKKRKCDREPGNPDGGDPAGDNERRRHQYNGKQPHRWRIPQRNERHPALRFTGKYHIPPGSSGRMHPPQKYQERQCRIGERRPTICQGDIRPAAMLSAARASIAAAGNSPAPARRDAARSAPPRREPSPRVRWIGNRSCAADRRARQSRAGTRKIDQYLVRTAAAAATPANVA